AHFEHLLVGYWGMRERFVAMVDREIQQAQAGQAAEIFLKMNSLEDSQMIEKLYEANQAGVKIRLIVRGICRLRPGVPGLSERIKVMRLVDQFLEHSRFYYFHNQGQPELYLGSADWMTRNLSRRIEVIFPLRDPALRQEVFNIMEIQWRDNQKAVILNDQLENIKVLQVGPAIRAQHEIYRRVEAGDLHLALSLPTNEAESHF
ncbi:MAG: phospholipase D-like domain-containing protein, partial [Bacteroidota bacterium]